MFTVRVECDVMWLWLLLKKKKTLIFLFFINVVSCLVIVYLPHETLQVTMYLVL